MDCEHVYKRSPGMHTQKHHTLMENRKKEITKSCFNFLNNLRRSSPIQSWANSVHVDFREREELPAAGQVRPSRSRCRYDQFLPIPALQSPLGCDTNDTWQQAAWYISYCDLIGVTVLCPLGWLCVAVPGSVCGWLWFGEEKDPIREILLKLVHGC